MGGNSTNLSTAQNYLDTEATDSYETQQLVNTIADNIPTFAVQHAHHRTPAEGSLIIPDPIEIYFNSLGPGQTPDPPRLTVAIKSGAVRSIVALIDNSQQRECILDPGCQIVSMSENTCHELGLIYDPSMILNMQLANSNIDQSLGLSRNVPFKIRNLTFYLQVHVIRAAAYDILLG